MKQIGPWTIVECLYKRAGTAIYATSESDWVVKQMKRRGEVSIVINVSLVGLRHSIETPIDPEYFYGPAPSVLGKQGPAPNWYAMRRYSGHVDVKDAACRLHWRTLAVHVLQFLEDFHCVIGLVHGDIKRANILMNCNDFVVCDYEFAQKPLPESLLTENEDHRWYFLSLGCELDEPRASWRADLVALGYILASLTVPLDQWTFESECWRRREGSAGLSEDEVIALRYTEVRAADPLIVDYLDRLKAIPWRSDSPPSRSFYKELGQLFASDKS